jgi:hypothetical protein
MQSAICPHRPPATGGRAHRSYLEAGAVPASLPYIRRHTRRTLAAWEVGPAADDVELMTSELVTNAIAATLAMTPPGALVALYLAMEAGLLSVLVWDCCPEQPVHRAQAGADAESGRGLGIVQAVSERWGTVALEGGKVVWAQLALTNQEAM